jgi:hypothetical protein
VQMPDEYDRIHEDLAPYWGLSPAAFRGLEQAHEAHEETFTLGRVGAHGVMVVNMSLPNNGMKGYLQGAYEIADTLAPVHEHLPPFRAVFSPHDNPTIGFSAEWRALALKAVREGRCECTVPSCGQGSEAYMHADLDLDHMPPIESVGWLSGCAKDSPARTQPYDLEHPPAPPTKKTFIHDHLAAMSPCAHPSLLHHHGQFLAHEYGPGPWSPPAPQFSYSVTSLHADIRPATPFNWVEDVPGDAPWDAKTDNRLLWRGSNTGIWQGAGMRYWRGTHRNRMVALADRTRGAADVLVADAADAPVQTKTLPLRRLNRALLDLEFSGSPLNCDDTTCPELQRMFEWDESMDYRTAGDYKYVMDVRARRPRARAPPLTRAGRRERLVVALQAADHEPRAHLQGDRVPGVVHRAPAAVGALRARPARLLGPVRRARLLPRRRCRRGRARAPREEDRARRARVEPDVLAPRGHHCVQLPVRRGLRGRARARADWPQADARVWPPDELRPRRRDLQRGRRRVVATSPHPVSSLAAPSLWTERTHLHHSLHPSSPIALSCAHRDILLDLG